MSFEENHDDLVKKCIIGELIKVMSTSKQIKVAENALLGCQKVSNGRIKKDSPLAEAFFDVCKHVNFDRYLDYRPSIKLGRLASGLESDKGQIVHAVPKNPVDGKALCGASPGGKRSVGWGTEEEHEVNCEKCLDFINQLEALKEKYADLIGEDPEKGIEQDVGLSSCEKNDDTDDRPSFG